MSPCKDMHVRDIRSDALASQQPRFQCTVYKHPEYRADAFSPSVLAHAHSPLELACLHAGTPPSSSTAVFGADARLPGTFEAHLSAHVPLFPQHPFGGTARCVGKGKEEQGDTNPVACISQWHAYGDGTRQNATMGCPGSLSSVVQRDSSWIAQSRGCAVLLMSRHTVVARHRRQTNLCWPRW